MMTGFREFHVASDAGIVHDVIVQQPTGPVGHDSAGRLLPDAAIGQFEALVEALEGAGITVLHLDGLLAETLRFADARNWLLERRVADRGFNAPLHRAVLSWLNELPRTQLLSYLTQGLHAAALPAALREQLGGADVEVLPALPDGARLRQYARWLGGGVLLGKGSGPQRRAASVNMSAVLHFSPVFDEAHFEFWLASDGADSQWPPIDGHDVAMLGPSTVLAGITRNTTPDALLLLSHALHRHGHATRIVCVDLRCTRCGSLDDCFVPLDHDLMLVDGPVMEAAPAFIVRPSGRADIHSVTPCAVPVMEQLAQMVAPMRLRIIDTSRAVDKASRRALMAIHPLVLAPGKILAFSEHAAAFGELERSGIEIAVAVPGDALCAGGCGPSSFVSVVSAH